MLPDLRTPHPDRKEITPDTITLQDLVDCLARIGNGVSVFQHTAESKALTATMADVEAMIDTLKLFRRGLLNHRWRLNNSPDRLPKRLLSGDAEAKKAKKREESRLAWARMREEANQLHKQKKDANARKLIENNAEKLASYLMSVSSPVPPPDSR